MHPERRPAHSSLVRPPGAGWPAEGPEPVRAVGLDLGERRIGVAMTDAGGRLALPYKVVERSGDSARDRAVLAAIVAEVGAGIVVVGLPLALSGRTGPAADAAAAEAAALAEVMAVPVVTFDERLTTIEAARRRREREGAARSGAGRGGIGSGDRSKGRPRERRSQSPTGPSRQRRSGLDAEAAAIMLEAWLGAAR
jgi:putative Holliday junction resolvase